MFIKIIDEVARIHKLGCVNLRLIPEKIWMIPEDGFFQIKFKKSFGVSSSTKKSFFVTCNHKLKLLMGLVESYQVL